MRTLKVQNTLVFKFIDICHNWARCDIFVLLVNEE